MSAPVLTSSPPSPSPQLSSLPFTSALLPPPHPSSPPSPSADPPLHPSLTSSSGHAVASSPSSSLLPTALSGLNVPVATSRAVTTREQLSISTDCAAAPKHPLPYLSPSTSYPPGQLPLQLYKNFLFLCISLPPKHLASV